MPRVEFGIEGTDIVRTSDGWNSEVDITLEVDAGTFFGEPAVGGTDTVRMQLAPVVFPSHLWPVDQVLAMDADDDFLNDLALAVDSSGIPSPLMAYDFACGSPLAIDQWIQDWIETGMVSMPGPDGPQGMQVHFRSANCSDDDGLDSGALPESLSSQICGAPTLPALSNTIRIIPTT